MKEKIFIDINGIKQGMFLQSENIENPVLLFLHGGPGSPEIAINEKFPTGLETIFTVCWWEQRGSCISYNRKITPTEMTIEQMISDTIAVTAYLKKRFHQEKVYIMGHSWGSFLGTYTVLQAPHLFHAYIGIGQISRQLESEQLAYTFMLKEFRKSNNKKMVRQLEQFPIDSGGKITKKYLMGVRSNGMNKLGIGMMRKSPSMLGVVVSILLRFKGYNIKEKCNYLKGLNFSNKHLWDFVIEADLCKQVPKLKVPVYIFQGKYDYQVSYSIAKEYATAMDAPLKGFYTFENSAHSPCFEEPEKMCHILVEDVLMGKVDLSDDLETI